MPSSFILLFPLNYNMTIISTRIIDNHFIPSKHNTTNYSFYYITDKIFKKSSIKLPPSFFIRFYPKTLLIGKTREDDVIALIIPCFCYSLVFIKRRITVIIYKLLISTLHYSRLFQQTSKKGSKIECLFYLSHDYFAYYELNFIIVFFLVL